MRDAKLTTLCYIEKGSFYLMLHRISKENDVNKGKWIGTGGHFEFAESPEDCLLREVKEETGLRLTSFRPRGIVTFISDDQLVEYMFLYTADAYEGKLKECNEGHLEWVDKKRLPQLEMWQGDRIFFRLIKEEAPFFSLKLTYKRGVLCEAVLDGKKLAKQEMV